MTQLTVLGLLLAVSCLTVQSLNPIIIVPGFGGNQLEAKLVNTPTISGCERNSDWYNVWLSFLETYTSSRCIVNHMSLLVNEDGTTGNMEGVYERVPGFGDTNTVEHLNPDGFAKGTHLFDYFHSLIRKLVLMGYKRSISVRAAPYDFRKAPNEFGDYFDRLTNLIEETYALNDNKPVVLLGHSMGGRIIHYFLQMKTQAWKDAYISAFISLATPWAGSTKALKSLVSGDDLGHPHLFDKELIRLFLKTLPSNAWLLPHKSRWNGTEVLVSAPGVSYTHSQMENLFDEILCYGCSLLKNATENILDTSIPTGVKTFCMYGMSPDKTEESYNYAEPRRPYYHWSDGGLTINYGPGDETVNKRSLEVCNEWSETEVKEFPGVNHFGMLYDPAVFVRVKEILRSL